MKKPLVDHWWTNITEQDGRGLAAAKDKLAELESISSQIEASDGSDGVRNVLDDGMIMRALQRCIEFHEGIGTMDIKDLHIYYRYATDAAKRSEAIIDKELDYLDL
ncbi:hypothetical protein [Pseudomonas fluorescens]|uniref:Uncharacterized protein n=1 Tax=Pseudomonas fluorescens TaxID=294 RepID=A0A944HEI3_PSEFL|nr:hypothetical protein [Pseudomonas fluorescens]MBT2295719.1 hypothetical protein [Pseudomonas fluorescens]MBT2305976.1 hypothetical protein [Pseudomonas fluorescens]MBT2314667.1 hypothetical protein [Pseudomonas fluorescens]MBT2315584.1 hypothetical protein [Pseudomonas fluorescens]MBT2331421.1 hypothetical protein [Pseudomonas fluorescens]